MANKRQRTIAKPVEMGGVGLFSGGEVALRFLPAPVNTGVVFVRVDLPGKQRIPATADFIASNYRRTCLQRDGASVEYVEHLLAALSGLGIDNVEIEISSSEVPGADGSALKYVELFREAGIVEQDVECRSFDISQPISVFEDDIALVALPDPGGFTVSYTLDYDSPLLQKQSFTIKIDEESFTQEIAKARTFCLATEIEEFRRRGLGKGATYQNTLVVDEDGVRENELRYPDEFVRHKILDIIGDLSLLNGKINGHIIGIKSGHSLNVKLVRKILDTLAAQAPSGETLLNIREIHKILPHRYPFLLVDRVVRIEGDKRIVGIKNVTFNEEFFQGHWPGQPTMPGVLQIEAMAQLAGILLLKKHKRSGKIPMVIAIDKVKFRRPVMPGDQLVLEAVAILMKKSTGKVYTRATVNGERAAEAQMKFMLVDESVLTQ